jgi:hypothetical protein
MGQSRWPKNAIHNWVPVERRKKGRPKRRWRNDVKEAMSFKRADWLDRVVWKVGSKEL